MKITAPEEQFTRVGVQVLDRKDGSFLVRYRMYASYKSLRIEVKTGDKHVAKSPYILKGKRHHYIQVSCHGSQSVSQNVFYYNHRILWDLSTSLDYKISLELWIHYMHPTHSIQNKKRKQMLRSCCLINTSRGPTQKLM